MGLTDALTGLANRRCFNYRSEMKWKRAIRDRRPLSFMMMDIDKFKNYNDAYGHPQGDALLAAAAKVFFFRCAPAFRSGRPLGRRRIRSLAAGY